MPESSPDIRSTSSSPSFSRASRATCSTCSRSIIGLILRASESWPTGQDRMPPAMSGERAERFVVFNLRLMAIGFAVTGFFFIAWPDGTLARLTEFGEDFGDFTAAPETDERLWLSLGFAYMVVITALAWIASTDVVRHRPMLLALAAGKAASSITSFVFFLQDDVFVYLLNGIVDGSLVGAPLLLWSPAGRVGSPAAPP